MESVLIPNPVNLKTLDPSTSEKNKLTNSYEYVLHTNHSESIVRSKRSDNTPVVLSSRNLVLGRLDHEVGIPTSWNRVWYYYVVLRANSIT